MRNTVCPECENGEIKEVMVNYPSAIAESYGKEVILKGITLSECNKCFQQWFSAEQSIECSRREQEVREQLGLPEPKRPKLKKRLTSD